MALYGRQAIPDVSLHSSAFHLLLGTPEALPGHIRYVVSPESSRSTGDLLLDSCAHKSSEGRLLEGTLIDPTTSAGSFQHEGSGSWVHNFVNLSWRWCKRKIQGIANVWDFCLGTRTVFTKCFISLSSAPGICCISPINIKFDLVVAQSLQVTKDIGIHLLKSMNIQMHKFKSVKHFNPAILFSVQSLKN